jgi:hypothetical protein
MKYKFIMGKHSNCYFIDLKLKISYIKSSSIIYNKQIQIIILKYIKKHSNFNYRKLINFIFKKTFIDY